VWKGYTVAAGYLLAKLVVRTGTQLQPGIFSLIMATIVILHTELIFAKDFLR
jgi:hypothetical protein